MRKLIFALSLMVLAPLQVHAYVVGSYDITARETTGLDAAIPTTAWWGSSAQASYYANAVGQNLGGFLIGLGAGPLFAYAYDGNETDSRVYGCALFIGCGVFGADPRSDRTRWYAFSAPVNGTSVPEPGTLALLGLGLLGMGLMRRAPKA